jgi:RNA polymerase sigma-70 factor (ECF subfamily)
MEEAPIAEPPDPDLLTAVAAGDAEAWTLLFRRYQRRIHRFSLAMTGSHALAEEAVQETFLALLQHAGRFDAARGTLGAWLIGVARKKLLGLLEREFPGRSSLNGDPEPGLTDNHGPRQDRIAEVRRAVLGLPPHYREVVVLCDLEEMEYEAAARALDCPVGTVRSRLHRARQMLAARLAPAGGSSASRGGQR